MSSSRRLVSLPLRASATASAMGGGAARRVAVAAAALAVAVLAGAASAAVYEVGDKAGWTIMGNPDYGAWAKNKKFHVNDVVGASRPPPPLPSIGRVAHENPVSLSLGSVFPFRTSTRAPAR